MYNEIKYNFGQVLPFYPFVDYSNIIPNLEKEIVLPTSPETTPPPMIYGPTTPNTPPPDVFEPTTPDTPPPPNVFQPTTPDTPPPDDGYVENINIKKLDQLKEEVKNNNDKSLLIQKDDEKEETKDGINNNQVGEIKGINIE